MREYLLVFLVAAAVTYLLTVIAREIALRTGAVAQVRDRDVHDEPDPVPRRAGDARRPAWRRTSWPAQLPFLSDSATVRLPRRRRRADRRRADLRGRRARRPLRARRAHQARRAGARGGLPDRLRASSSSSSPAATARQFSLDPAQGALLTGLLVVATVNAVNFVDGLDGLAAGRGRRSGRSRSSLFCYQLTRINGPIRGDHRGPAQRARWPAPASASCPTTSTRPGCSWATAARC